MKNIVIQNWTFFRVIRLLMGIAIIFQSFIVKDLFFVIAGFVFSAMALFNTSCCGTTSCNSVNIESNKNKKEII